MTALETGVQPGQVSGLAVVRTPEDPDVSPTRGQIKNEILSDVQAGRLDLGQLTASEIANRWNVPPDKARKTLSETKAAARAMGHDVPDTRTIPVVPTSGQVSSPDTRTVRTENAWTGVQPGQDATQRALRGRSWVTTGLAAALSLSIGANMGLLPEWLYLAAGPVLLFLVIEVLTRLTDESKFVTAIIGAGLIALAGGAAFVSFSHMKAQGLAYGQSEAVATAWAVMVDGAILILTVLSIRINHRVAKSQEAAR